MYVKDLKVGDYLAFGGQSFGFIVNVKTDPPYVNVLTFDIFTSEGLYTTYTARKDDILYETEKDFNFPR